MVVKRFEGLKGLKGLFCLKGLKSLEGLEGLFCLKSLKSLKSLDGFGVQDLFLTCMFCFCMLTIIFCGFSVFHGNIALCYLNFFLFHYSNLILNFLILNKIKNKAIPAIISVSFHMY